MDESVNYIIKPYIDSYVNSSLYLDSNIEEFYNFLIIVSKDYRKSDMSFYKNLKNIMIGYKRDNKSKSVDNLDVLNFYIKTLDFLVVDNNVKDVLGDYLTKLKESILNTIIRISKLVELKYTSYLVLYEDEDLIKDLNEIINTMRIVRHKISQNSNIGFITSNIVSNSKTIKERYERESVRETNRPYLSVIKGLIGIK